MTKLRLNCDLGEASEAISAERNQRIMPYIDEANIACGFHAGDPITAFSTLKTAVEHGVSVGAHPSYPDRENFGRVSVSRTESELYAETLYQVAALAGLARATGTTLKWLKPHGALYHDMMNQPEVMTVMMRVCADFPGSLALIVQANQQQLKLRERANSWGIEIRFEAFADRRYLPDGSLQPRSIPGAVLNQQDIIEQVTLLLEHQQVLTTSGQLLTIDADTICIHGDTSAAVDVVQELRKRLANYD